MGTTVPQDLVDTAAAFADRARRAPVPARADGADTCEQLTVHIAALAALEELHGAGAPPPAATS